MRYDGSRKAPVFAPFPFRVFSHSPPLSSFLIPLWHAPVGCTFSQCYTERYKTCLAAEIVGMVQHARSPQEWGGLWKRERERKPLGGERISICRCALSPLKEVVARIPVDGSCVTRTVNQIKSHASPQASGRTLLCIPSTQSIKSKPRKDGHKKKSRKSPTVWRQNPLAFSSGI